LIEIETASKILMGAYYKADTMHPLEYCAKAAGVEIQVLKNVNPEY
jgi:hypothetical protein